MWGRKRPLAWSYHTFASFRRVGPGHSSPVPSRCPGWLLSGPLSFLPSSLPALHTRAALYVRTFSQGKLLEHLGHGISRVDLHSQLCPCKERGGDILIQMLLGNGAMSHDRCLNNKTQLALELSFDYTSNSCLKQKQKQKITSSFQIQARPSKHILPLLSHWM